MTVCRLCGRGGPYFNVVCPVDHPERVSFTVPQIIAQQTLDAQAVQPTTPPPSP